MMKGRRKDIMNMLQLFKRWQLKGSPVLPFNNKVPISMEDFRRVLDRERERANRNQHSVSLVLMEIEPLRDDSGKILQAVQLINARIRQVDEIGWFDQGRIGIILPYTTKEGAVRLTLDLLCQFGDQIPKPRVDIFTFFSGVIKNNSDGIPASTKAPQ